MVKVMFKDERESTSVANDWFLLVVVGLNPTHPGPTLILVHWPKLDYM